MDIQLKAKTVLQLQELAKIQEREISDILMDAIEDYVEQHTNESAFREQTRTIMHDHKWLLTELADR